MDQIHSKRPRTSSSSESARSSATAHDLNPPPKASRIVPASYPAPIPSDGPQNGSTTTASHPILCNLPPTCNRRPTPISSSNDLERHYAMYHAHVCEVKGCGCVFPEARLLELHQTECHDPIAALRKERKEKIFQCHIPAPACGRSFSTPKTRRLHLIEAHSYPKQYFFAVTNKGIGGLLKKWGEGASLIRKDWKPRDAAEYRDGDKMDDDEDEKDEEDNGGVAIVNDMEEPADLDATPRILPKKMLSPTTKAFDHPQQPQDNSGLEGLTQSLNTLSLVPNSVRFGRGSTKARGFAPENRGGSHGRGKPHTINQGGSHQPMDLDAPNHPVPAQRGRGGPFRGRRARGRARGV
ncbi:hypothetical protein CPB83DRAFT_858661 [Crepidotus variabilis]|uniref:C2H2-type domain-containing protein n=1 Tax=Crepidotus variabilis TaxID=179855 RepID=A0A9P6EBE3_9AGAR|nr:hypothetical protein CPB83DRAFT_858661 [Crepidotus variabilis]